MSRPFYIVCILLLSQAALAQESLKVQHFGVDQGLPQSSIWDILEDDFGFLWVSTADGLCRFDGYNFITYRSDSDDSLSIGGNTTHMMSSDKEGNLWLTHDQGFDRYIAAKGVFQNLYRYATITNVYNKTIGEDNNGNIWVWIGGEGLLQYDKKSQRLLNKFSFTGKESWRNREYSRNAFLNKKGIIWLTQSHSSLVAFDTKTATFTIHDPGPDIHGLCEISDSVMLAGTPEGLLRYNTYTNRFVELKFKREKGDLNFYTGTKILQINEREFWIATPRGIFVYDEPTRSFTHHYISFEGGKSNFMFAHTLYKDHSGNIWIGTNGDGLKKYSPESHLFKHYKSTSDKGDIVKSIYVDGKDNIYIGYFDNGFDIFSKTKGFIRKVRVTQTTGDIQADWVYAIAGIDNSKLFLSFIGRGISFGIYDCRDGHFLNITASIAKTTGLPIITNSYPVAIKTSDNKILFNYGDALLEAIPSDNDAPGIGIVAQFKNDLINCIFEDRLRNIWVGTMNGYYVRRNGQTDWKKGLQLTKRVKSIAEDKDGKMWFGTTNGLYAVDKKGAVLELYRTGHGLINDYIYGILCDDEGDLWFSHNHGITRYSHQSKTFRNFSVEDGLQSNEFNTNSYYKSPTGELYFGGINGVNAFLPAEIRQNQHVPVVRITKAELNDQPLPTDTVIWAKQELKLSYTQNTVAFEFAGLEFTEPTKNQYAYRMTGVDKDWIRSGNKRFARYANLPPGHYSFEVKATNNDGVWNETPTTIKIVIVPPYWQTNWFRAALTLLAVLVISIVVWLISRQRYLRKLRALEVKQTIQHDRDRISRELHDNVGSQLSLISSNLDWVSSPVTSLNEKERSDRIEEVSRISKDVISNLRETIWALKKAEVSFSDFTDKLKLIAQQQVSVLTNITLNFHDGGTDSIVLKPEEALHLLRICQEAIHNAVKHAKLKKLDISWHSENGKYEVCIADDGMGFIILEEHDGHYGLENMKQRAKEIKAMISIITAPGAGAKVTISK